MDDRTVFLVMHDIGAFGVISHNKLMARRGLTSEQVNQVIALLSIPDNCLVKIAGINGETIYIATVGGMQWYRVNKGENLK